MPLKAIEWIDQRARTIAVKLGREELERGSRPASKGFGRLVEAA